MSGFTNYPKHSVEFFHSETEMTTSSASDGPFFYILQQLAPRQASLAGYHGHHSVAIIGANRQQLTADLTSVLSSSEGRAEGDVTFLTHINSLVRGTGRWRKEKDNSIKCHNPMSLFKQGVNTSRWNLDHISYKVRNIPELGHDHCWLSFP